MQIQDGRSIINITDLTDMKTAEVRLSPEKERQLRFIDQAAKGSIEAAADLAEGYLRGSFGEPANKVKHKSGPTMPQNMGIRKLVKYWTKSELVDNSNKVNPEAIS